MAFDPDANRGPEILAVNYVFGIITVVIVLLRVYARAVIVKAFGLDDWLMILSTIFYILYTFCSSYGAHFGTGQHMSSLEADNIKNAMKYWWFCYIFYILTMICSKVSFAWFLLRITTAKIHSWIIYGASAVTVLAGIVFFFVTLFQCHPVSYYWDRDQSGNCFEMGVIMAVAYLYSGFSVITDFTFAILPAFVIWSLKMARKTKLALIVLIAMGGVACSAIIVRLAYLTTLRDPDFLWATTDIVIWTSIEQGLAISAASLATLRPLVKIVAFKLGISSHPTIPSSSRHHTGPSSKHNQSRNAAGNPFDGNVYVMSEFSHGSTYPGSDLSEKLGTRSTAYTELGKGRDLDRERHLSSDNESQEKLH